MYLKRLEMIGFKSFPEKIKLEFIKGITAVVGPNGSGKSNVSDAIRWVLGEQSAKSLRGAKMEDVIFAGTANRKPLGYAEVSMIIDNEDRAINIDYSEVTVTRRVYRSGEGEYQLNGTHCRLKDIQELFMDTGIGKEGYSIIGQGRIEEILSSKGEDRRLLFEEAAGIVKYKSRRHEALNKLEKEKQNILRLNDIIYEIESQLGLLEIQSETAKKYLSLSEKLKLTQVNIFISEVDSFSEKNKNIDNDINILTNQINDETKTKNTLELDITTIKNQEDTLEESIDNKNNELVELRSTIEQSENNIVLFNEQKNHISINLESLSKEIENTESSLEERNILKEELDKEITDIKSSLLENRKLLSSKIKDFEGFNNIMSEEETMIEEININIISKLGELSEAKTAVQKIESTYEALEEKKEDLNINKENALENLIKKNAFVKIHEDKIIEQNQSIKDINNSLKILADEKADFNIHKKNLREELSITSKNLHELSSKHKILTELENNYEGYYKSVKNILQYKKNNPNKLKGIIGAVGELIEVNPDYETAIEIALSQSVQNIITENENDAKEAIEFLKQNKFGRATFLPISTIKNRDIENKNNILACSGVVGIARDLVSYNNKYENIISSLLGRVVIVDNINSGIVLSKKYNHSFKIVTLEGDLFNAGGSMSGGSSNQKSTGIFSRQREITSIQKEITTVSEKESELNNKLLSLTKQLEAIYTQEDENKILLQNIQIEIISSKEQLNQVKSSIKLLEDNINQYENEDEKLMNDIVELNKKIREQEKIQLDIETIIENHKEELVKIQTKISSKKLEKDSKSSEITELRVNVSTQEEKFNSLLENLKRVETSINERNSSILKNKDELQNKIILIEEKSQEIVSLKDKIVILKSTHIKLSNTISTLIDKKQFIKEDINKLEATYKENTEILSNLKNELTRLEVRKETVNDQVRSLYDTMWEEYEITYNQALKYERLELAITVLQSDEKSLKAHIKQLGNINIGAIDEYKALKERYEFLENQRADILDAEEKLKEIITQLTTLMEEQFSTQFKIISENFNTVFSEMFGGGRAYLKLADENNILETGIDIIAQPPGKNLQSLSLLSGGERALTAMALLFAILRMKPSPFCILDEIEAALDDANVYRYANYLQSFCNETQFILITHRKGVMESADVLYGITMQEQGVSKLVSVKFEEANVS